MSEIAVRKVGSWCWEWRVLYRDQHGDAVAEDLPNPLVISSFAATRFGAVWAARREVRQARQGLPGEWQIVDQDDWQPVTVAKAAPEIPPSSPHA